MPKKSFQAKLKNFAFEGSINPKGHIVPNYEYLSTLLENSGANITCVIDKQRKNVEQNRYFYGVICYSLAEHLNQDPEDIRDWLLQKFTGREVEVNGETLICSKSLSLLNDYELTELIYEVENWIGQNFKLMLATHTANKEEIKFYTQLLKGSQDD